MSDYVTGIHRGSGRQRWGVLQLSTGTWIFPSKPGYGPAIKKAILLRKGIEKVPAPPPLQTFRAMYQGTGANVQRITTVQAANAVDAERIAAERWGAPLAEVKAWPCW